MIGRGKHGEVFLYEITEQDLLLGEVIGSIYQVGNVLIFADKKCVALGKEIARAEDLDAAKEYIDHLEQRHAWAAKHPGELPSDLYSALSEKDASLRSLTEKVEQRDELLKDISEALKSQREENELLHAQLGLVREQLIADELERNEIIDDLQSVSKETQSIETTLDHVLEEKYQLEQELAEKIIDLVELNFQNDDMRKQLDDPAALSLDTVPALLHNVGSARPQDPDAGSFDVEAEIAAEVARVPAPTPSPTTPDGAPDLADGVGMRAQADSLGAPDFVGDAKAHGIAGGAVTPEIVGSSETQILTMASGKRIHILHEFPTPERPGFFAGLKMTSIKIAKILVTAVLAALILGLASVIATAYLNSISLGEALDFILRSVGGFFGS